MAFTAREVILVFRGQNYLSGAIRRASMDVAGLSRVQQLQVRRATAQNAADRIAASRAAAQAEQRSVQAGGARYLALQDAFAQREINLAQLRKQAADADLMVKKRDMAVTTQQGKLDRAVAAQNIENLTQEARQALPTLIAHHRELLELRQAELASAEAARGIVTARYQKETNSIDTLNARKTRLAEADARLTAQDKQFAVAQEIANLRLQQANALISTASLQRYADMARKIEHVSRVVQMMGLIGTATFGYLATNFAKFQTQMTVAATQSTTLGHNTVAQVQANALQIGKAIENMLMAGQTIAKPEELGQSIYDIFSGVTLKGNQQAQLRQGIALMKQFNQVVTANAGLVSMNEVTQAGITLMNDFGVSVRKMPAALNLMQASVRYGRMTMEQFLSTFNQAAPAAKGAGYSFEQMASVITFASRKFPNIRFAGTAYARLVDIIGRSRVQFRQAGIEIEKQNGQLLPLPQIIENITKKYPGLIKGSKDWGAVLKEITGTTGTYQARRLAVFLAQDPKGLHTIIRQVTGDTNELTKSLRAAEQSTGVKWEEFVNQLRGLALVVGEGAARAFQKLAGPVRAIVNWFRSLSPHTQRLIGYFGAIISVGALVSATLTSISGGFIAVGLNAMIFFKLQTQMEAATKAIMALQATEAGAAVETGILGGEMGAVLPEVALVIAAFAALGFLMYKYPKQTREVGMAFVQAAKDMEPFIADLIQLAKYLAQPVVNLIKLDAHLLGLLGTLRKLTAKPWKVVISIIEKVPGAGIVHDITHSGAAKTVAKYAKDFMNFDKYMPPTPLTPIEWLLTRGHGAKADPISGMLSDVAMSSKKVQVAENQRREAHRKAAQEQQHVLEQRPIKEWIRMIVAADAQAKKLGTVAAYQKSFKLQAELAKRYSGAQLQAIQAVINNLESGTKAQGKYSDAYVLNEYKNAQKLLKIAQNKDTLAAWKAYYTAIGKYQTDASTAQQQAIDQMFGNTTDAAKKATITLSQITSNMMSLYQNLYQQNENLLGQLFQGPYIQSAVVQDRLQYGAGPQALTATDLIRDRRSQIRQFRQITGMTNRLRRRGLPGGLLDQIRNLPPDEAAKYLKIISGMTAGQLREYSRLWKQGQRAVHDATMRQMRAQLKDWRKHGQQIALAIAAGLRDENTALQKQIENMIRSMFPGMFKGGKHPGTGGGGHRPTSTGTSGPSHVTHQTTYHVTATRGAHPTIKQQVAEANWHHRTRQ